MEAVKNKIRLRKKEPTSNVKQRAIVKYLQRFPNSGPQAIIRGTGFTQVSKTINTLIHKGWIKDDNRHSNGESYTLAD